MFILKSAQKVALEFTATDKDGNPIELGPVLWGSSDRSIVDITADGVAFDPEGPGVGNATITATADGDPGDGVRTITAVLDIQVVAGDAAIFNIVPGTPEPRDEAPPAEVPPAEVPADTPTE